MKQQDPELLEFLKRHEVRTMAKDAAKLREQQAGEERSRISGLGLPQKGTGKPERVEETLAPEAMEKPAIPLQTPPTRFSKIFVRLLVVLVLVFLVVNIVAFSYWMLTNKEPAQPANISEVEAGEAGGQPQPSFFEAQFSKTIAAEIGVLASLEQILKEDLPAGFTLLAFPDTNAFFQELDIEPPEELSLLFGESAIFAYADATKAKKRIGFVVQLENAELAQELLRSWEPQMEQSFALFMSAQGQKDKAYVPFFRTATHKGMTIRFQTFSLSDLGLCYALVDNKYLVFSGSLESTKAAIDNLKKEL